MSAAQRMTRQGESDAELVVAVAAGDLPPTLAQTAIDGSFTAYARAGAGSLRVQVSPPPGSGQELPSRLRTEAAPALPFCGRF